MLNVRWSVCGFKLLVCIALHVANPSCLSAQEDSLAGTMIGYTELRTDLSGGRHANIRTSRAVISNLDGTGRRKIAETLIDNENAWTQFAGWSPDGSQAIINRGWQDPENAAWEEEHKTFRMEPGKWEVDACLVALESGAVNNVSAIERVSHYNAGLFFLPNDQGLAFSPLIDGISQSFVMDLDGRNKRNVTGEKSGFAYGYTASPTGDRISYHENYQIYLSRPDGSEKQHIDTGNSFNFGPRWSPDGEWLLFLSGRHYASNPYIVRHDGTELRKLVDLNDYRSHILFLDVPDFHEGSSDLPVWSADGKLVYYTAIKGDNVELFQVDLAGNSTQLTETNSGTLHYHPNPSPDGKWLLYSSKRDGVRQLFVLRLDDRKEFAVTDLQKGTGAMWPHWRSTSSPIQ